MNKLERLLGSDELSQESFEKILPYGVYRYRKTPRRFLDQKLNWDIARVEKRLRADYDREDLFEIKVDEFWGFDSCMMGRVMERRCCEKECSGIK